MAIPRSLKLIRLLKKAWSTLKQSNARRDKNQKKRAKESLPSVLSQIKEFNTIYVETASDMKVVQTLVNGEQQWKGTHIVVKTKQDATTATIKQMANELKLEVIESDDWEEAKWKALIARGRKWITKLLRLHLPELQILMHDNGEFCLDLFYQVVPDAANAGADSHKYLKQLLPVAWSHNPSTTLKLICNKLNVRGKDDQDGFYTAAFWLHHNHPKTLACNVPSIAGSLGNLTTLLGILYRILQGQDRPLHLCLFGDIRNVSSAGSETILALARMAVERYQRDPDYRFLHDRISDLFADCLKSDIQNLNKHQQQNINDDEDDESTKCLEITSAADCCPSIDSSFDHATLLCESIAKKFFPRESYPEYEGVEEADYAYRVRHRLRKEVLVPLRKVLECSNYHTRMNKWGYNPGFKREPCVVKKYLEDVKAAGNSKIEPGALLPHEIIGYVNDGDVGQVAEIQWKAMIEHIYLKQGKFKNCLPVCHNFGERLVALQILMSELSEEPWKGKLINFSENPQLYSLQGLDDLKSKGELVKRMDCQDWELDMHKVFDLILEVAVKGHLKPEQMIRRVFVFAMYQGFDDALGYDRCWKTDYEAIQRKFKDNGYGDVVPPIVFWNVSNVIPTSVRSIQQGVAMLSGFNTNLIKSFLDNDGEIGPDHVMEAAISDPEYQNLVVVD